MKQNLLSLMGGFMLVSLACGLFAPATPAQPGVETIVAATIQALTPEPIVPTQVTPEEVPPTQTAQPSGISISFENTTIIIPKGLASSATSENIPAVSPDTGLPWGIEPAYVKLTLNSYPLQGTMWHPEIRIYPTDEFRQIDSRVGETLDKLKKILADPSNQLEDNLPFLPFVNAGQVFHAQMQVVNFQNGSGIRYVTQFDQAPIPINNQEMFYTFQGLSQDGKYFISITLPISAAFLPADGSQNSPTPADGIPVDWNNFENFPVYLDMVTQKINATDPNAFTPSLSNLDTMVQSLLITATP